MKNIYLITLSIFTIALLNSCASPLDKEFNKHTSEEDLKRIKDLNKLDSVEFLILSKYMVNHGLVGPHVLELHETYHDILREAKEEHRKKSKEALKGKKNEDYIQNHESDKIKKINSNIELTLLPDEEKTLEEENIEEENNKKDKKTTLKDPNLIKYKIVFTNRGKKDIKAFKGTLVFFDNFKAEIKRITFTSLDLITVGDSKQHVFTINLKQLNSDENIYSGLNKSNIEPKWYPERLIFTDGEIVE